MPVRRWVIALVATVAFDAAAQPAPNSDNVAAAEQLFQQARGELEKGNTLAACNLFDASRKLDPQRGTLLNLADCYEKAGLVASAWGRFRELEVLATKAADEPRLQIARERIAALEPRLPKLAIAAPSELPVGLIVRRDDTTVDPATFGSALFVDPGEHVIEASAPGYRTFTTKITIKEAEKQDVAIPALEKLPEAQPVGPKTIVMREESAGRGRRILGIVFAGAGVATLATGIGFGISARSEYRSAFDDGLCMAATNECFGEGQERTDRARDRATIANIFSGVGVGLAAVGAVLYFTAPSGTDVSVVPTSGGGAVTFGGRW